MNFVVLTAALSGANAKLYVASRLLFSMGRSGWAPASMGKLNASGSPRLALLVSSYGIVTALIIETLGSETSLRLHHGSRILRPDSSPGSYPSQRT